MAECNWRNGAGTQQPPLMTSVDGTYQVGVLIQLNWDVLVFKRSLTTGLITDTFNLSSQPPLVTYGITPIVSDALGGDDHYAVACGIDDQNRTWIAGNSLGLETIHLIRSAPNVINSWTTFTFPYPGFVVTGSAQGYGCYNHFNRLSDNRLLWFANERNVANNPDGIKTRGFILPLGSSTWSPLVGTGQVLTSETTPAPERVYLNATFVERKPHLDRVWITLNYRWVWNDGATGYEFFILYNDTVTNSNTWKRIDGTSQPMPVTYANINGTSAMIPRDVSQDYWFTLWQMYVDPNTGFPHVVNSPAVGGIRHYWWDGSAWQNEPLVTTGGRAGPFMLKNGNMIFYKAYGRVGAWRNVGTSAVVRFGEPIPPMYISPLCDPIQQSKGSLHLLVPNGDTPEVHVFGDHNARAFAV